MCDPLGHVHAPSAASSTLSQGHWPVPSMTSPTIQLGSLLTSVDGLSVTSVSSPLSALYVVDLKKFRKIAAGDRLRGQYQGLSQDPNSLSNLDQVSDR